MEMIEQVVTPFQGTGPEMSLPMPEWRTRAGMHVYACMLDRCDNYRKR